MPRSYPPFVDEARRLVAANRLMDATALIQAQLGGRTACAPAPRAQPFEGKTIELSAVRSEPGRRQATAEAAPRFRARFPPPGVPNARPNVVRPAPRIPAGAEFLRLQHDGPAGQRGYRLYVPATPAKGPRPLLVMLHGCTQNPEDFAVGTRMNELAEERGVLVAYPEQTPRANASLCWNWFEPQHQRHGEGEPAILIGIIEDIARSHSVDRSRVFAAGLSAGGAMAAVLGAAYPGTIAAVGVHSGLPHASAVNVASALSVMRSGRQNGNASAPKVRTIVFHGERDTTVHPANGERVAGFGQAGTDRATTSGTINGRGYTRTVIAHTRKQPGVEHWRIAGLQHAWSGGDASGSYADPAGPDASREMLRFFLDDAQQG